MSKKQVKPKAARKTAKKAAKKTGKQRPAGRPTAWKSEYAEVARNYALLGATDKELAEFFSVAESTIHLWKKKHPEFVEALKEGKAQADAAVARRLFLRACGYTTKEAKIASFEGAITDVKMVDKEYPPDTTAAIFWLKNRRPSDWRDKIDHDVEFSGEIEVTLGGDADEE